MVGRDATPRSTQKQSNPIPASFLVRGPVMSISERLLPNGRRQYDEQI